MFVLDASALAKSFLDEPRSDALRAWLGNAVAAGHDLHVPSLAASEIARIIQKERPELDVAAHKELWRAVLLGIHVAPVDMAHDGVWDTAAAGLSYYDAEYVDLARRLGATLVTADAAQVRAAAALGIDVLELVPGAGAA